MRKLDDNPKKSLLDKKPSSLLNSGSSKLLGTSSKLLQENEEKDDDDIFVDVEYTGDPTIDARAEQKKVLASFHERDRRDREATATRTDTCFYTCVIFETEDQRDEFLKRIDAWGSDTADHRFVDGVSLAERMGIKLAPTAFRSTLAIRPASRWVKFVRRR